MRKLLLETLIILKKKTMLLTAGSSLLSAIVIAGCAFSRAGYESPKYSVLKKDAAFEVREYPDLTTVATPMDGRGPDKGNSFRRLFRYISGDNASEEKIAMTTPVFSTDSGGSQEMVFVVPRAVADAGKVPAPNNEALKVEKMQGGKFASYRFSGSWDEAREEKAKRALLDWASREGLTTTGRPMMANYDPPFTPSFLRRNEALIRLRDE